MAKLGGILWGGRVFDPTVDISHEERDASPTIRTIQAGRDPIGMQDDFCDWIRRHGIIPEQTYRIDIVGDEYFVAHRYKLDGEGKKFFIQEDDAGDMARENPVAVVILEPLPDEKGEA
jgi:hypothetical protein